MLDNVVTGEIWGEAQAEWAENKGIRISLTPDDEDTDKSWYQDSDLSSDETWDGQQ